MCTDGSEHSQKALEKAAIIAQGSNVDEVAIIHVYDNRFNTYIPFEIEKNITAEEIESFRKMIEKDKKEKNKMLSEALKFLKRKNIKARTIFREGHPSHTILNVAREEGFDMIVIGSRGLSGLEKVFLGSVSNAIIQEAKNCSILIVK